MHRGLVNHSIVPPQRFIAGIACPLPTGLSRRMGSIEMIDWRIGADADAGKNDMMRCRLLRTQPSIHLITTPAMQKSLPGEEPIRAIPRN